MPSRKRRSNRLTVEQLEAKRDLRECELNQAVVIIGFGQEETPWWESLYRSISLRTAKRMVADGDAERFSADTQNGKIVLFRELKPVAGVQYQLPKLLNAKSAEALAGYQPGARISGRELQLVEHAIAYPFIGDTKAPLVMPRVTDRERDAARKLFLEAEGKRPATAGHCYRKAA